VNGRYRGGLQFRGKHRIEAISASRKEIVECENDAQNDSTVYFGDLFLSQVMQTLPFN
jgi:hypothetical protein